MTERRVFCGGQWIILAGPDEETELNGLRGQIVLICPALCHYYVCGHKQLLQEGLPDNQTLYFQ